MDSLRLKKDINLVFKRGRKIENKFLKLLFLRNSGGVNRLVVIIPKTSQKSSVVRNTLRRRTREFFRKYFNPLKKGFDLVIFFKKEAFECSQKVFYEELNLVFKKISQ